MEKKTVLVTGIGGNVGQGIIRNIHSYDPSIRVVGTNVTSFSAGNHLCDTVYKSHMRTIKIILKRYRRL